MSELEKLKYEQKITQDKINAAIVQAEAILIMRNDIQRLSELTSKINELETSQQDDKVVSHPKQHQG